jgi:hypothetical protein
MQNLLSMRVIYCARAGELAHLAPSMYLIGHEKNRGLLLPAMRTGVTAMKSVAIASLR